MAGLVHELSRWCATRGAVPPWCAR